MDISNFEADRAECAKEISKELENCDEKTFYKIHLDSQKIIAENIEAYAAKHNIT